MMSARNVFSKFIELGLIMAIGLLALAFYFADLKIRTLSTASSQVNHTQQVRLELSQVGAQVHESATMQRRFLVTHDSIYLAGKAWRQAVLFGNLQQLKLLNQESPAQQRHLDTLQQLVQKHIDLLEVTTWPDFAGRSTVWEAGNQTMDSIQVVLRRMNQLETMLLENQQDIRNRSLRMAPFFTWVLLMLALIIATLSYLKIKNDLRKSNRQLEIHLENTKKITELNITLQHAEQIAQAGNWRTDLTTGARQYSDNVYRLFGYEPGAFPPGLAGWLPGVHPDDRQMVHNFGELARQQQLDPPGIVFRYTRPDGQQRYMHADGKIIHTAAGESALIGTIQDVTESHHLRQALEERIQFTETLLDNLVDSVIAYDQDLNMLSINKACETFFNLDRTKVVGKNIREVFPQVQESPAMLDRFQRVLQGETVQFATRSSVVTDKDLDIFFIPLYGPERQVSGVLTIARDVTEAHALRSELEERSRFAELLIESSVDLIAAYDKDLHYTVWNQRCEEALGLKKAEVLGKHIFEVFPMMKGQEITQSLYRALDGQSEHIAPQPSVLSNHHYENFVLPLRNEAGEVSGVLTVTHNVTESYRLRQELEERSHFAETIIESSVDMIVTYDTELRVTAWNKKSEEIFRITRQAAMGRHVQDIFPHIIGTERLADLQAVLQGRSMQYNPHELAPFGIHANLYLLPLKDHSGQVTGVLSITHDVTEVVQSAARLATLNQSLEVKNKQLANINAELASFSYVASHDLQEPLRKIQSFASRILATEKDRLSDTGQDAFRRMQSAADRMQQLIDDLLTYSRTNTQTGEFSMVDLNKLLHEAEHELSETVQEKGAVIEADPLPEARVVAFQFRQLLANLLSNALKYQRPGVAPQIRITCHQVQGADIPHAEAGVKTYFRIRVADNGIGFEQQYAERIFELFQRLHGRSEYKGTGIGLAICRKIMQNHQGYLLAEGRPGEGSTFTIYLPV